jgi:hypothetical protein
LENQRADLEIHFCHKCKKNIYPETSNSISGLGYVLLALGSLLGIYSRMRKGDPGHSLVWPLFALALVLLGVNLKTKKKICPNCKKQLKPLIKE